MLICFSVSMWVLHTENDKNQITEGFIMRKPHVQGYELVVPPPQETRIRTGKAIISYAAFDLHKKFPDCSIPIVDGDDGHYAQVLYLGTVIPDKDPTSWFEHVIFKQTGVLVWETGQKITLDDIIPDLNESQRKRINTFKSNMNDQVFLINYKRHPNDSVKSFWDCIKYDIAVQPIRENFKGINVSI